MAKIHVVNNIFKPDALYDYYINPNKVNRNNYVSAALPSGWTTSTGSKYFKTYNEIETLSTSTLSFELVCPPAVYGQTSQYTISRPLTLRFQNAAQHTRTGVSHDVAITISSVTCLSRSTKQRHISIAKLSPSGLWVQAYVCSDSTDTFDATGKYTQTDTDKPVCGIKLTANIAILNSQGQPIASGTFAYPFLDMDIEYDIRTDSNIIAGEYSEGCTLNSGCTDIYVDTHSWLGVHQGGQFLGWAKDQNNRTLNLPLRLCNNTDEIEDSGSLTGMVCIFSGSNQFTWTGTQCLSSLTGEGLETYTITYNANGGSGAPATQYKLEGQEFILSSTVPSKSVTLTYDANGGQFNPNNTSTYTKQIQVEFRGWATSSTGAVKYHPGDTLPASFNSNLTLYAVWGSGSIGTLPTVGSADGQIASRTGYRLDVDVPWTSTKNNRTTPVTSSYQISSATTIYALWEYRIIRWANGGTFDLTSDEVKFYREQGIAIDAATSEQIPELTLLHKYASPQSPYVAAHPNIGWKKHGQNYAIYRAVHRAGRVNIGWHTSATATSPLYQNNASTSYTGNIPITLYAIWKAQKLEVNFYLGFGDNPRLRSVEVDYGGSVPQASVPVPSQTIIYDGHKFWRGGMYQFVGWSDTYTSVTHTKNLTALWEFVPVWYLVERSGVKSWIPYHPKEGT